jgi:uncharacterized protein
MNPPLSQVETRILGCLIEKKMATPEYYPLSMNALVNACNQKSNREPVVSWDEDTVRDGIQGLTERRLVFQSHLSRVPKYEESFLNENDFVPQEAAILCTLLNRGPQTAGEIRGRTERLYAFDNLDHVNRILENLITRNHVKRLEREPGRKEVRFAHTFGGGIEESIPPKEHDPGSEIVDISTDKARIQALEEHVEALGLELDELKQQFTDFRKQFE